MSAQPVYVWRHPRAAGAEGRCVGRVDLVVDRRKAKRLARRIQRFARRERLPTIVVTSPRQRCRDVGRWLARWGWVHRTDPALAEIDFGAWDGQLWSAISKADVDRWCEDLLSHRPGGGESVAALLERVRRWHPGDARVAVSHGGWMSGALWLACAPGAPLGCASQWPAAPAHGHMIELAKTTNP